MAANLNKNIKAALKDLDIRSVTGWTDKTVALHWLKHQSKYKVFVQSRVKKIVSHELIYIVKVCFTKQNPGDTRNRVSPISNLGDLCLKAPNFSSWPR